MNTFRSKVISYAPAVLASTFFFLLNFRRPLAERLLITVFVGFVIQASAVFLMAVMSIAVFPWLRGETVISD